MREPTVALTHSPRGWAQELHFFLIDHGGAQVRGYVVDAENAFASAYDVLVIDDITSFLTPRLVAGLRRRGTAVIGVFDPTEADGAGKRTLVELGVDDVLAADTGPHAMLDAIARHAGSYVVEPDVLATATAPMPSDRTALATPAQQSPIVVVAGASGGVGATEVAIGFATRWRMRGVATVLVDADDQAPGVAQRLALPVHPNLRTAIDTVQHRSGAVSDALIPQAGAGIEVLVGLASHRDWQTIRPAETLAVIEELSEARGGVVVNIGPRIEELGGSNGRARYATARAIVQRAHVVVLVGSASPIGVTRVVEWMADARPLISGTPVHVLMNCHDGGRFTGGEIEAELRRSLLPDSIYLAPEDRLVARAAWDGHLVTRGAFVKTIDQLVHVVRQTVAVGT